jgi:MtN3 and saliva related transmembrane protein
MAATEVHLSLITALGYCAALVSTASFAPQAWRIIKSRQTKDISTGMYALTVLGFALWLAFGALENQWPLVASNSVCLFLSAFILIMKLLPQKRKEEVADALTTPDN